MVKYVGMVGKVLPQGRHMPSLNALGSNNAIVIIKVKVFVKSLVK